MEVAITMEAAEPGCLNDQHLYASDEVGMEWQAVSRGWRDGIGNCEVGKGATSRSAVHS